jgi:hypothetical protein
VTVVVDTGVGVVANGEAGDAADPACVQAAAAALAALRQGTVVIDDGYCILREYLSHLHHSGQPGPGDAFVRWVLLNQGNPDRCELVHITSRAEDRQDFEEFPSDPRLTKFDRADRKFVAVACASASRPPILVAVDRGWGRHGRVLRENGVEITFLCPHILKEA